MKLFKIATATLLMAFSGLSILCSCRQGEFTPQEGDLLFCVSDTSALSQAITAATQREGDIQYDHVALYAEVDGVPSVIEATARKGVRVTDWEHFITKTPKVNGKPGVDVMRIKEDIDIQAAIDRALSFKGQAYDWAFLPSNGKMYCSELIYESFRREDGTPLFSLNPMSFRDKDGNIPTFWVEIFKQLGTEIPDGQPGTNPNTMAAEPVLSLVHRYFD